jgi:hypothetical protein
MTEPSPTAPARLAEPVRAVRPAPRPSNRADRGIGWLVFAALMVGVAGVLNTIYGIAAVSSSSFYVRDAKYVLGDLETFGWILLVLGVVQMCASAGILAWASWARWVGVACAAGNAVVQILFIPSYPFLAITLYAVDLIVIYGLVAYGGRLRPAA